MNALSFKKVSIKDEFWAPRIKTNREVTLPIELKLCRETGRIDALKLDWKEGMPNKPHHFWDSDIAKWLEAAAYSLAECPDETLEKEVDEVIELIGKAQAPDGYFNSYYQTFGMDKRWTDLKSMHELYCAGHLIEAAVAYFEATGKSEFLEIMRRYADLICKSFGPEEGKIKGYPGHQEIELALVRLYSVTGENRYLELAEFFLLERGQSPNYFNVEAELRGDDPQSEDKHNVFQAHKPVLDQKEADGHAVRACYMYSGMADVARETGNGALLNACRELWKNIVKKRMYIIGGIGSSRHGERFTFDYDLSNEEAYAETCAAIALIFFAKRMLDIECDSKYADIMEKALYNCLLSGLSLDGKKFFYENPLAVYPKAMEFYETTKGCGEFQRQEWFSCSCCPPNIARLLASLSGYIYSQDEHRLMVNLYISSEAEFEIGGCEIKIEQKTDFPWNGSVKIKIASGGDAEFCMALRVPEWSDSCDFKVNGCAFEPEMEKGYAFVKRVWSEGDELDTDFSMPVRLMGAHPLLKENCGKVAIQRGPLIYCLEEADNGTNLNDIVLDGDQKFILKTDNSLYKGAVVLEGGGFCRKLDAWKGKLYNADIPKYESIKLKAIPYPFWANRSSGEMIVWINCLKRKTFDSY
jgi:DUF1680 family protein